MESPVGLPNAISILARLVVVISTTLAFQVCTRKPNPPPGMANCKQTSRFESIWREPLRPLAMCFSLAPGIVELAAGVLRLAGPPAHDVVSGTCAERISFNALALAGCLFGLCGMGIRLWCYQALGRLFTFELALLPGHRLVTTGPYAFVRHPSYTGGLLALVGMTIANMSRGSWAYECGHFFSWWGVGWGMISTTSMLILVERCPREDKFLREAFKEEWEAWRKRVRWRMIPWVY